MCVCMSVGKTEKSHNRNEDEANTQKHMYLCRFIVAYQDVRYKHKKETNNNKKNVLRLFIEMSFESQSHRHLN